LRTVHSQSPAGRGSGRAAMRQRHRVRLEFLHILSFGQIGFRERSQGYPETRVHAACLEMKGQPFYGWFVDGKQAQDPSPFLTGFSSGFGRGRQMIPDEKRLVVEFEPSKPVETGYPEIGCGWQPEQHKPQCLPSTGGACFQLELFENVETPASGRDAAATLAVQTRRAIEEPPLAPGRARILS
jgi:hypothetical protein